MKKMCKHLISLFFCIFAAIHVSAQDVEKPFHYETTWRILLFSSDHYSVNERPEAEYDEMQGFIQIYDILIKYVHSMRPFNDGLLQVELNDLGVWCELYLINNEAYQHLFIGDHVLSDGKNWVLISEVDYKRLSEMLEDRRRDADNPYDGDKEKILSHNVKQIFGQPFDEYDAHFKRMANEARGITGRELESNASSSIELINPKSIGEINSSVASQEIGVTSSSSRNTDVQAESRAVVNGQSSVALVASVAPAKDEQVKITRHKNSDTNESSALTESANHSLIGWLFLAGLGMAFVWYYWRKNRYLL